MKSLNLLLLFLMLSIISCKKEDEIITPVVEDSPKVLLYLPFNGNANDESGNGNNASTVQASLTSDRFGNINSAYYFNGTSNYISIPNSTSLKSPQKSITMSAWVYVTNWYDGSWAPILVKSQSSGFGMYGMQLVNFSSDKHMEVTLNGNYLNGTYSFGISQWYFVVFTWDGTKCKYFVNSSKVGERSFSGTISSDNNSLIIGQNSPEANEYLNGKVDEVRIYDKAISQSVIDSLYNLNH